jgi:hypothetical protein
LVAPAVAVAQNELAMAMAEGSEQGNMAQWQLADG